MVVKRALTADNEEVIAKQGTFVYPPRTMGRSRSKLSSSVPGSDDEPSTPVSIELNSEIDRSLLSISGAVAGHSDNADSPLSSAKTVQSYRGLHSHFPPHIEIPLFSDVDQSINLTSPDTGTRTRSTLSASSPDPPILISSSLPRKGSQSSIGDSQPDSSSENGNPSRRDLNLASPAAFQFPPSLKTLSTSQTSGTPVQKSHNRVSPTHLSASNLAESPSTHQATYSLDIPGSGKQKLSPSLLSPSITRTRSATALPETKPINIGTATVHHSKDPDNPSLVPPLKPFAKVSRNRSGSDVSQNINAGTPGLKDVLKIPSLTSEHRLGISDLLPPSPSSISYGSRNFLPSPSQLSSVTSVPPDSTRQYSAFRDAASSATSFSLGLPRSSSPPDLRRTVTEPLPSSTPITSTLTGPQIRPLDYLSLITHESTHAELARTIEDLTQWLSLVEVGLSGMLETTHNNTIEEEKEVASDTEDNCIAPMHLGNLMGNLVMSADG